MTNFLKDVIIKFKPDMTSLKHMKEEVQRVFKDVTIDLKKIVGEKRDEEGGVNEAYSSFKKSLASLDQTFAGGSFGKLISAFGSFKFGLVNGLMSVGSYFISEMKGILNEGKQIADELLDASRLSNAETRETMLTWGLSQSGAYGLNKAKDVLGFQSEEDFYYATDEERKLFFAEMEHFSKEYTRLADEGFFEDLLKTNIEMTEFEEQMNIKEAEFYKENIAYYKEMKIFAMQIKHFFMQLIGTFLSPFTGGMEYLSAGALDNTAASAVNNNTDNSKTINISYDNSFNNQSSASDQTSLEKAINNAYNVLMEALS